MKRLVHVFLPVIGVTVCALALMIGLQRDKRSVTSSVTPGIADVSFLKDSQAVTATASSNLLTKPAASSRLDGRREINPTPEMLFAAVMRSAAADRLQTATEALVLLADRPEEACRLANWLVEKDSSRLREHGNTLVAVLVASGAHETALRFSAAGGAERDEWMAQTFRMWARQQPAAAARAALAQGEGFETVAAIWTAHDPAAFSRFAEEIQESVPREIAFAQLNRRDEWIRGAAASEWPAF